MVPIHKIQHRSRKRVACACRIDCLHLLRLRMRSGRSGKSIRSFASAGEQHQTDTPYQQFFQYAFDLNRSCQELEALPSDILIISACGINSHTRLYRSSRSGHNGKRRFGSKLINAPASLAYWMAASCASFIGVSPSATLQKCSAYAS